MSGGFGQRSQLRDKRGRTSEGGICTMGPDSCEQRSTSDVIGEKRWRLDEYLQGEGGKMEHVFLLWESSHGDRSSSANRWTRIEINSERRQREKRHCAFTFLKRESEKSLLGNLTFVFKKFNAVLVIYLLLITLWLLLINWYFRVFTFWKESQKNQNSIVRNLVFI